MTRNPVLRTSTGKFAARVIVDSDDPDYKRSARHRKKRVRVSINEPTPTAVSTASNLLMAAPAAFLNASLTQRSGSESGEDSDEDSDTDVKIPPSPTGSHLAAMRHTRSRDSKSQATNRTRRYANVSRGTIEPQSTTHLPADAATTPDIDIASFATQDSSRTTSPQGYSSDEERQSTPASPVDTLSDQSPVAAARAAAQALRQAAVALNLAAEYITRAADGRAPVA